jgi:hypothetical protein
MDLANLGGESETCVGSRVRLVGVSISFEKNFYRLPFTPPLSGSPYRSFKRDTPERCSSCSGCTTAMSDAGSVTRDIDALASCAGRCYITQPSSCITSTSGARSGAGPEDPPRSGPPGGGITVSRGLRRPTAPDRLAPRTSPPTPLVRVVGDQRLRGHRRRLFLLWLCGRGRDARRLTHRCRARRRSRHPLRTPPCHRGRPQLERLDKREGRDGRRPLINKRKRKGERLPLEIEGVRGKVLLTSSWRMPVSSSLRAGGTSVAPAGDPVVPAGTSTDSPAAYGSTPASGTNSTTAPSAPGDGGTSSHLLEVVRSPSLSSSSSDDKFTSAGGGGSPYCSHS